MFKKKLYLIVFTTGAVIMVMELIGSRILAPILGTSIFIWTSLIGIVLGSMSLGYYLGGKAADKNPSIQNFSLIIFISGLLMFVIIIIKNPVLEFSLFFGIKYGAIVAATLLFALPSIMLGMVSPYAARMAMIKIESSGSTIGNLYAISTFGSIFGTFLAGFYLIPTFGSINILYGLSLILFLVSAYSFYEKAIFIRMFVFFFLFFCVAFISNATETNIYIADEDSEYSNITVYDRADQNGKTMRIMSVESFFDSAMYLESDDLVFEYTKYFQLDKFFKKDINRVAMFGGAAYSVPKDFIRRNENGIIDVVEIDSKTTELAKKYFRLSLESGRINVFHEDARIFINRNSKDNKNKYDVIYNDAFSSTCSAPFQLTTREALENISSTLKPGGIYMVNVISSLSGEKSIFFRSEYKTIQEIFENVYVFPVSSVSESESENVQNIIVIAVKGDIDIREVLKKGESKQEKEMLNHLWNNPIETEKLNIFTDDYAPVNYLASKICLF
ncbi:fused MFS/spermidine synthase [Patescibacteria group bacterium]|nr:fused MFS/spermidine synthase [Patescibacteria group bacterium]